MHEAIPAAPETPGVNTIFETTFKGDLFRVRRPSRADDAAIARRLTVKLMESPTLRDIDGVRLEWEARFEICLVPRGAVTVGECAPAYLLREDRDKVAYIVWDQIDTEDFDALCLALEPAFGPKKKSQPAPSGTTADASTSG